MMTMIAIQFNSKAATGLLGLQKSVSLSASKEILLHAIADIPLTEIHHETLSLGKGWKTNQPCKGYGVSRSTLITTFIHI